MNMKKNDGWQNSALLRVKEKFRGDVFFAAYVKIISFYVLVAVVTAAIAEYIIYYHAAALDQNLLNVAQRVALSHSLSPNATTTTQLITSAVGNEIKWFNIGITAWILFTISGCAYFLATITLLPIRQAMDRQRRFIANIAHELRTPLSVMKTNFEVALLNMDETSREELVQAIRNGMEEADRMTGITRFLLRSSSIEERGAKLDFSEVDLGGTIRYMIKFMEPIISGKDVTIRTVCDDAVFVWGNATATEEMLINLVKNAVAYTPAGGSVTVRVTREPAESVTLSVEDTGIGIPAKDLPNIFEPFYRGENAVSQRTKKRGSGIGLTIVKEIVELHGARITVKSEVGKGTLISVQFPKAYET